MTEIKMLQRRDRSQDDPTYQPDLDALDREFGAITRKVNEFAPKPDDEIDPVVRGLITHLPAPGSVWPAEDRKLWLELMEGTFRLIFREKAPPSDAKLFAAEPPPPSVAALEEGPA